MLRVQSLVKKARITVRLTRDQLRRLSEASVRESRRREELVDESALLRELGMKAVDELLAQVA